MAGDVSVEEGQLASQAKAVTGNLAPGNLDPGNLDPGDFEEALQHRLATVAPHLVAMPFESAAAMGAGDLVHVAGSAVHGDPSAERLWLLLVALAGSLPDRDDMEEARYRVGSFDTSGFESWLLDWAATKRLLGGLAARIRVVTDLTLVDVDFSARRDLHTGIQEVARNTLSRWLDRERVLPVAWTDDFTCWRELSPDETARATSTPPLSTLPLAPRAAGSSAGMQLAGDGPHGGAPTLVVPWATTVIMLETPDAASCERLGAAAEFSANAIVAVGYDCIPAVSADMLPEADVARFARYLTVVKHLTCVAAISESAAGEFRGFTAALRAQGLAGPRVVVCGLPTHSPGRCAETSEILASRRVVVVGSIEPRKNQISVALAAEIAWRQGHEFDLTFVSGSAWHVEAVELIGRLRRQGRPVSLKEKVPPAELDEHYASARFSVFVSLHEGFGLPVVESLSRGVPVITSRFGPMAEVGEGNGAVLVDPSDVNGLVRAMTVLLDDDAELLRLRAEIDRRETRNWDDYAEDLRALLVGPTEARE